MTPSTPADRFGPLLEQVQRRGLFADGKTFADAVPRRPAAAIMADFAQLGPGEPALRRFVAANFTLAAPAAVRHPRPGERLRDHIRTRWSDLARRADDPAAEGSLLRVDGPYVVPGGRFAELYYWDSYFALLGLVRDGQEALARSTVAAFIGLIERFGHIPNGTRTYYLGRSQPPLFFAMLDLLPETDPAALRRRLRAMTIEHDYWMRGSAGLAPGEAAARVVGMPDGTCLNRYWDDRDTPRDESFADDIANAATTARPAAEVWRALRAGAESGWDFSSRWLDEGGTLATIRTHRMVPVDLNAFIHGLELAIARLADALGEREDADRFAQAAERRREAMTRWLWSSDGYFADFDLDRGASRPAVTAATLAPLFTGTATPVQAAAVADRVRRELLAPGGLRTTTTDTGQQWDRPNGWAPLQWIAYDGLRRYGHGHLARAIAARWVATVETEFRRTGLLHEKYDVERGGRGSGGEYVPQVGFGWTNGVTAAFMDLLADEETGCSRPPAEEDSGS